MLLRYHFGLGVGHIYSHIWGSASLGGFDDLENERFIFELNALEWRFLDTVKAEHRKCF